jgi:hypothetical protein
MPEAELLYQTIDRGRATAERRASPLALWPQVRSVVMLGMNYGPHEDPLAILRERARAAISVYAQGDDYHELIKARLKDIARWLVANAGGDVKVFVDTAAVMEKPLAAAASLGWQGKHTNLVSRQFGSWLFLGAIFSTLAKGEAWTTLELKINFVRPISKDTGPVRAEGRIFHRGRTVATSEGDLKDRAGKLYAHATTTCMIFPAEK